MLFHISSEVDNQLESLTSNSSGLMTGIIQCKCCLVRKKLMYI